MRMILNGRKAFGLTIIILIFSFGTLFAETPFLTEPELTELSVKAFDGDKAALKRIVKEFNAYQAKLKKSLVLTRTEKDLYDEIVETVQILDPKVLPQDMPKKIVVKQPPRQYIPPPKENEKVKPIFESQYFNFAEGATYIFSGNRKKFLQNAWSENGETLKSHILKVEKEEKATQIVTLNEIFSQQNQWLAEQTLMTYRLTAAGVQIKKEIVFDQPVPGTIAAVGEQDAYLILKFPIKEGSFVSGYRVETITATVKSHSENFQDCLRIKGPFETLTFAPDAGLVRMEIFDEEWILKERQFPEWTASSAVAVSTENLPGFDHANPEKKGKFSKSDLEFFIKGSGEYCKRNHLKFDRFLSAHKTENGNQPLAYSTALVFERDKKDPDHRRYQVLQQKWKMQQNGKNTNWILQ